MTDRGNLVQTQVRLQDSVALARYTTLRIGGAARWFTTPATRAELLAAVAWAQRQEAALFLIGRGSNLLIDSAGLDGLVVSTLRGPSSLESDEERGEFVADAGVPMPTIATAAQRLGWDGFAPLLVIPGTLGAGVAINAGLGGETGPSVRDVLVSVEVLDAATGEVGWLSADEAGLAYRTSSLAKRGLVVLRARLRPTGECDPESLRAVHKELLGRRTLKQPSNRRNCGSVFKAAGGVPAGKLIDEAGLKGLRVGNACVSPAHANWIENLGAATSEDVRELVRRVIGGVAASHGVTLEREMRIFPDDVYRHHTRSD